ncbi:MAG: response regulator transcription factor [Lachnospiraceae bacterium]|jgi:two-component system response regulator LytT|nr:response regulator transcription factor [Lachnospiraceae bacterium]
MTMIKFAICDDEPFMTEEISQYLSRYMEEENMASYCVSSFPNGRLLLESDCDFDLIFLDIQMEQPDGMETAKMLRQRKNRSLLVFVTVMKECVFDAFEVHAYDYLIKPLDYHRFKRTMDRAVKDLDQQAGKHIIIRKSASCQVVPLSQIMYCEVQGRKVYIHQADGKVIDYYDKLEDFQRRVDRRFFRCHRSYLVNLDYIRGCAAGLATLSLGDKIPVSRLRERELTETLLRHMKEREY